MIDRLGLVIFRIFSVVTLILAVDFLFWIGFKNYEFATGLSSSQWNVQLAIILGVYALGFTIRYILTGNTKWKPLEKDTYK